MCWVYRTDADTVSPCSEFSSHSMPCFSIDVKRACTTSRRLAASVKKTRKSTAASVAPNVHKTINDFLSLQEQMVLLQLGNSNSQASQASQDAFVRRHLIRSLDFSRARCWTGLHESPWSKQPRLSAMRIWICLSEPLAMAFQQWRTAFVLDCEFLTQLLAISESTTAQWVGTRMLRLVRKLHGMDRDTDAEGPASKRRKTSQGKANDDKGERKVAADDDHEPVIQERFHFYMTRIVRQPTREDLNSYRWRGNLDLDLSDDEEDEVANEDVVDEKLCNKAMKVDWLKRWIARAASSCKLTARLCSPDGSEDQEHDHTHPIEPRARLGLDLSAEEDKSLFQGTMRERLDGRCPGWQFDNPHRSATWQYTRSMDRLEGLNDVDWPSTLDLSLASAPHLFSNLNWHTEVSGRLRFEPLIVVECV